MSYTLIDRRELTSAASSIEFTEIPQIYTDLVLQISGRGSTAATNGAILISFNGDNEYSNGSTRWLQGSGSATSSSSATFAISGIMPADNATANTFGSGQVYINNYTTSFAKSNSQDWVTENNATQAFQRLTAGIANLTSPVTSMTIKTDNPSFMAGTSVSLYGINRQQAIGKPKAIGGAITFANGYWVHTFNASGSFYALENLDVDYLVLAGGGGGGNFRGGGGGAGGYITSFGLSGQNSTARKLLIASRTSHTVLVGAGGPGGNNSSGLNGGASAFSSIVSEGGGGGGGNYAAVANVGGSGGGGAGGDNKVGASGTTNQGFAGGNGNIAGQNYAGGGGGGSASAGSNSTGGLNPVGGAGGSGITSSITGSLVTRAAGGGGSGTAGGGAGGSGVGGTGGTINGAGTSAAATTGSGGGGSGDGQAGAAGGSGIIIVLYPAN
jgi:hypothetical protein